MAQYIEGYSIVFDTWYRSYDTRTKEFYYEKILSEACTQKFVDNQLVLARLQHNNSYIISTNYYGKETLTRNVNGKKEKFETGFIGDGRLSLKVDSNGLYYSILVDETNNLHRSVVRLIQTGVLQGSSHARLMLVEEEIYREEKIKGEIYRTFFNLSMLSDVAPVTKGENPHCTVQVITKDSIDNRKVRSYDEQMKALEDWEFEQYYKKLQKESFPHLYK